MTKRPKVDRPTAAQLLEPARVTRERVDPFQPTIVYAPRDGKPMISVVQEGDSVPDGVRSRLAQMRAALGPADWIAVTTDAYSKEFEVQELPSVMPGDLAHGFTDGDPSVFEQMIVVLVDRYRGAEVASQRYRFLPSEGWEWGEVTTDGVLEGDLTDAIRFYM